jgi:hypothetical protein
VNEPEGRWFYIYAREIAGDTYYICSEEQPVITYIGRRRRVHPIKNAYEYVGPLHNQHGSTLDHFIKHGREVKHVAS